MGIGAALILTTLCALLWDAGIVLQKLAVDRMPKIRLNRGPAAVLAPLLRSAPWMAGLAASAIGWGLFAFALSFTPVSLARSIQGSGFVVLAVLSLLFLRHRLTAREWAGVLLVSLGIAALGIANGSPAAVPEKVSLVRLVPALAVCLVVCSAAYALPRVLRLPVPQVISFSVVAGILLGLGDVATKALILVLQQQGFALAAATAGACLVVFYVSGFLVLSRAYQHGRAILVTAVSDVCARAAAILLGISALGEALAAIPRLRAAAVLGYGGIILGVVLLSRFSGEDIADRIAPRLRSRAASEVPGQPLKNERSAPTEIDRND
jgi:drug/metabolite transporter (DMT)-like permease